MEEIARIVPTPGFEPSERAKRIRPSQGFRPTTNHTRALPNDTMVSRVEAEWCPFCLGRNIGESFTDNVPVWHCNDCGSEW